MVLFLSVTHNSVFLPISFCISLLTITCPLMYLYFHSFIFSSVSCLPFPSYNQFIDPRLTMVWLSLSLQRNLRQWLAFTQPCSVWVGWWMQKKDSFAGLNYSQPAVAVCTSQRWWIHLWFIKCDPGVCYFLQLFLCVQLVTLCLMTPLLSFTSLSSPLLPT